MSGIFGGVDVGASSTKVALLDADGVLIGSGILRSGTDFAASAEKGLAMALNEAGAGIKDLINVFSCGYGRKNVGLASETRTEIACHAAGAFHYFPRALTIIDIGGQDNKIIKLNHQGMRTSFKMNRKCAAGTGAFLEEMALRLDLQLSSLDELARKSAKTITLGSYCTVFTATEVLARIREGALVEDLVKGLFRSVLQRVREMDTISGQVVMTGGVVAHNPFIREMMAEMLGVPVEAPPRPQLAGAEGAALLARNNHLKASF